MRPCTAFLVVLFLAAGEAHAVTCGETVTTSVTLNGDLDCPGDGLWIGADAITIDCAGHAIRAATPGKAGLRAADHSGIEIRNCKLSGWSGTSAAGPAPGLGAAIAANRIEDAAIGIAAFDTSGLRIDSNLIRDNEIGVYEQAATPPLAPPNRYAGNRIAGNRGFGMAIVGASPVVGGNVFTGNGGTAGLPEEAGPLPWLFGEMRAAIAIVPFAGLGYDAIDNGVSDDDAVPAPTIGALRLPNVFRDNDRVDVYALDARPANAASLATVNRFQGAEMRFQQDWFGMARILDRTGAPVAGAPVRFLDSRGRTVLEDVSSVDGYAPASVDPSRSQGRLAAEPGGPVPHWPVFTERRIDGRGRMWLGTPHTIRAGSSFDPGCSWYAWNGRDDVGETGRSLRGRYQTAVVTLGSACPLDRLAPAAAGGGANVEP